MKKITILAFIFVQIGCHQQKINEVQPTDNKELIEMLEVDQKMRKEDSSNYEPTDRKHRKRVFELLAENKINTELDKYNAAFLLQHTNVIFCNGQLTSISPENYLLAYTLSNSAFNSGYKEAGYMVALNYDRYLLYTEGYQKYGTQKIYDEKSDIFIWAPIDSLTTDGERSRLGVPDLKTLLTQSKMKAFKIQ